VKKTSFCQHQNIKKTHKNTILQMNNNRPARVRIFASGVSSLQLP